MLRRKLGLLLSTPPSHPNITTVVRLSEEGLRTGAEVYLYLIDEGVRNVHDDRLQRLADEGIRLFVCAYGCQQHRVATAGLKDNIQLCGLVVLSNIINGCDRFVAFN